MESNRLTLLYPIDKIYGMYQCSCGKTKRVRIHDVRQNNTRSCGCLRNERVRAALATHESSGEKLWMIWNDMRYRCDRPYHHAYKHYGARGITVCKEWRYDYLTFRDWAMKNGYKDGLVVARINTAGNYEPANCKCVPRSEQNEYKSRNIPIDLKQLAKETGIRYGTLLYRYHHDLDLITGVRTYEWET